MAEEVKNPWNEFVDFIQDDKGNSELANDFEKFFERGQKAASTRIRKKLTMIQKWCKETKRQISEIKQQRKAATKAE